ncbi:hypothetical protein [Cellulosimicrobium sp. Marseille-Q4280]|uniref:hypothetical protein n=1 Tax=Cellulosimicrobium sp. Marseille-Q4280 TaxID=2937992 RepID=UPI00203C0A8F|nr:hypothetical protein [Cellulosimicrobium sp. Marseille-Q4280]
MTVSSELATARTAATDLLNHILLRCSGRPDGCVVVVSYTGEEDVADKHPLAVVEMNPTNGSTPPADSVRHAIEAVKAAGAERIAMVAFDDDIPQMLSLTATFAVAIGLPVQRLLVDQEIWLDPDHPSVTGRLDDTVTAAVTAEVAAEFLARSAGQQ